MNRPREQDTVNSQALTRQRGDTCHQRTPPAILCLVERIQIQTQNLLANSIVCDIALCSLSSVRLRQLFAVLILSNSRVEPDLENKPV